MTKPLAGKVALVTGASRGIGRAVAERLAVDGAAIAVHYHNNKDLAADIVAEIELGGGRAIAVGGDVAIPAEIRAAFDATEEAFGRIDIVVNNAAICASGPLESMSEEIIDQLLTINLKSVIISCQQAATRLHDSGRIINISTTLPAQHIGVLGAYAASKGGIEWLSVSLARQLAHRSITVNSVAPGPTETDMLVPEARAQLQQDIFSTIPLGRLGHPSDLADAIAFLAGPSASWITGQRLAVNGGAI